VAVGVKAPAVAIEQIATRVVTFILFDGLRQADSEHLKRKGKPEKAKKVWTKTESRSTECQP